MKKFTSLSFLFIAALLIFSSCKKDEETPSLDAKMLEGTWNFDKSEQIMNGQSTGAETEEGTYEFKTDKTLVVTSFGSTTDGTYSIAGQSINVTIDGETKKWDVKEMTASKLIISNITEINLGLKFNVETIHTYSK